MKSKLGVFFVGFGAGIVVAFLGIGLAPDRPNPERHVSRPTVIYDDTNVAAMWKQGAARVRWQAQEP
jgi:hypothetical protein